MKKLLSFAVGAAMFIGMASTQQLKAQVYADYDMKLITAAPYETLTEDSNGVTVINAEKFFAMPTFTIPNRDDGYAKVTLPFTFNYNGIDYREIYISVNGFITFNTPPNVIANEPSALFKIENSFADNVIAPFWGNHYYRTKSDNDVLAPGVNQWAVTRILTGYVLPKGSRDSCFVVEWKNLNIFDKEVTTNVATFQARLYKPAIANSNQGVIEFAYSTAGKQPGQVTSDNRLTTTGASVGIKGESGILHANADFMNALQNPNDKNAQITTISYTNQWQPTGGSDKRFRFDPYPRFSIFSKWGDGDADMSRAAGGKHFSPELQAQNRYVTVNDARVIMSAIAKHTPLDSIKGRAAFHGDVNHNGRFIYKNDGTKYNINWRSKEYNVDLPLALIGNEKQLMFQVTEYDAALILHYLSARIPSLPWILDTIPMYGKVEAQATNVLFGKPEVISNGDYTMPVYLNGNINGAVSSKFDISGTVINVTNVNPSVSYTYENGRVVLAASSKFNSGEAVCYVTFKSNTEDVTISNITFNDTESNDVSFKLSDVATADESAKVLTNYPNPFLSATNIAVNVEEAGFYSLSIFDVQGNLVKTLVNGNLNSGVSNLAWDATDNNGVKVESGMYIYRLTGNNVSISNTMQIVK